MQRVSHHRCYYLYKSDPDYIAFEGQLKVLICLFIRLTRYDKDIGLKIKDVQGDGNCLFRYWLLDNFLVVIVRKGP